MAVVRKLANNALTTSVTELLEKYDLRLAPGEELDEVEITDDPETGVPIVTFYFDQVYEKEV